MRRPSGTGPARVPPAGRPTGPLARCEGECGRPSANGSPTVRTSPLRSGAATRAGRPPGSPPAVIGELSPAGAFRTSPLRSRSAIRAGRPPGSPHPRHWGALARRGAGDSSPFSPSASRVGRPSGVDRPGCRRRAGQPVHLPHVRANAAPSGSGPARVPPAGRRTVGALVRRRTGRSPPLPGACASGLVPGPRTARARHGPWPAARLVCMCVPLHRLRRLPILTTTARSTKAASCAASCCREDSR